MRPQGEFVGVLCYVVVCFYTPPIYVDVCVRSIHHHHRHFCKFTRLLIHIHNLPGSKVPRRPPQTPTIIIRRVAHTLPDWCAFPTNSRTMLGPRGVQEKNISNNPPRVSHHRKTLSLTECCHLINFCNSTYTYCRGDGLAVEWFTRSLHRWG